MKRFFMSLLKWKVIAVVLATLVWSLGGLAAAQEPQSVLFNNVNIFDGKSDKLLPKMNVLVEGNVITSISKAKIPAQGAQVIDGDGLTLMPGLIDNHVHLMLNGT
jgi:imidazolonepropionase-like amidohydrolase